MIEEMKVGTGRQDCHVMNRDDASPKFPPPASISRLTDSRTVGNLGVSPSLGASVTVI